MTTFPRLARQAHGRQGKR